KTRPWRDIMTAKKKRTASDQAHRWLRRLSVLPSSWQRRRILVAARESCSGSVVAWDGARHVRKILPRLTLSPYDSAWNRPRNLLDRAGAPAPLLPDPLRRTRPSPWHRALYRN